MKALSNKLYKAICSVLASDNQDFKRAQTIVLLSRILNVYPSNNQFCLASNRLIAMYEKNIQDVSMMIETMKNEGEDNEIISNIEFLRDNPMITTSSELSNLCQLLSDYLKYSKILKVKDSWLQSMDIITEDNDGNMKSKVDTIYKISSEIVNAYNSSNVMEVSQTFDTSDKDGMNNVVAITKDSRSPSRSIMTSIRGLNQLLSPAYLPGCIYVYAALPGNYKSGILLSSHVDCCRYNEHIKATTNGKTPISMYITMENSISQTVNRLWALLYPSMDMSAYTVKEASDMIESALTEKGFRSVILYYGYREKSTTDIGNIIKSYNDEKNEVVALFFDYIKRVRPGSRDASVLASEKSELNAIMNELRVIALQNNIPIITGHQLNRVAAQQVDELTRKGGFNKTDTAMGRSNVGTAWEVLEVADWAAVMNIESDGSTKMLMIKEIKQRDRNSGDDINVIGIRHPFITPNSFALQPDIFENCSMSQPIFNGKATTNFMLNDI